jgi:hypothetical protein
MQDPGGFPQKTDLIQRLPMSEGEFENLRIPQGPVEFKKDLIAEYPVGWG